MVAFHKESLTHERKRRTLPGDREKMIPDKQMKQKVKGCDMGEKSKFRRKDRTHVIVKK